MRIASKASKHAPKSGALALAWALILLGVSGCAHVPDATTSGAGGQPRAAQPDDAADSRRLMLQLAALDPTVWEEDAGRVATCAFDCSRQLAREYRVVRPARLHNFLVNVGLRKRGLCYHWADDLLTRLQPLNPATLELRRGTARAGTHREHNCVVVTARGQPFERGIVLDAWRRCGQLVWSPVSSDKYPWVERAPPAPPTPPAPP